MTAAKLRDVMALTAADIGGGNERVADFTRGSAVPVGAEQGVSVVALVKATEAIISKPGAKVRDSSPATCVHERGTGGAVRIAVSGAHGTGKTTLAEALADRLPRHVAVPEPYLLLEEQGHAFDHPPSVEDYVAQLRASMALLRRKLPNAVFDRCPLDFLGYIFATRGGERFDPEPWRPAIVAAMTGLDLLVFLRADPAHDPPGDPEEATFRAEVDGWLRDIVEGDDLDLRGDVPVLALDGPWERRIEAAAAHLLGG